jgi:autotransporter-associated beta strand protein
MRTLLTLSFFAISATLHAGSATWKLDPTSDDWHTAANWSPETVPNSQADIATFGSSNTTGISLSEQTQIGSIIFDPNASAFTVNTATHNLSFFEAGVINNSPNEQNFVTGSQDGGRIQFRNAATAGNAVFTNQGDALQSYILFHDNATAGEATIINHGGFGGGVTWFFESSTAGNATFYNFSLGDGFNDGVTVFEDDANAGTATIICEGGGAVFHKQSSAAESTLTVSDLGNITFLEDAGAGEATITAKGAPSAGAGYGSILFLSGNATAGNATLIANGGMNGGQGAYIVFWYKTRGHKARVELFGNSTLDISNHDPLAPMTIGSLEGDGRVVLGANNLTIGRNHLNTIFSGIITDGGNDTGGSITKVSGGALSLTEGNSYTGGTTVESGTLLVDNIAGSGTGTGPVQVIGGTLGGNGIIAGAATIGGGDHRRGTLEPGINATGLLTIENTLTFGPRAIYRWDVDATAMAADEVAGAEITISNGALFLAIPHRNAALPIGTVFTVINNTGAPPISGTFGNLPDHSSFTAGINTFEVNYEGGDGNDLTLTVVQ